mmetsp:Transcript_16263/g.30377  ORF Transcript_16263/g.30377 Transcript_16263/m.30377 type:complete len:452 (-) Transcript_16263:246-1601(-)
MLNKLVKNACRQILLTTSLCIHARRLSSALHPHSHRITSYNVLSSHLAEPSYFTNCSPEYLHSAYRYEQLIKKMDQEVEKNAIICLQEVSADWAGKLHTYFAQHDYHFVTALYGNKFDGYMGVAMAFSNRRYVLDNANIKRIVDTKKNPPRRVFKPNVPPAEPPLSTVISGLFSRLLKPLKRSKSPAATPPATGSVPLTSEKVWAEVLRRQNEMIALQLRCKQSAQSFYVGTYHMPCVFRIPEVMTIHAALASQHLHRLASSVKGADESTAEGGRDISFDQRSSDQSQPQPQSLAEIVANSSVDQPPSAARRPRVDPSNSDNILPYILAGDFNIKPQSSVYRLLTEGDLPPSSTECIEPSRPGDTWAPRTIPLNSAYMLANKREPDFTNHAQIRDEVPFIDTLDYVFLSRHWRVTGVAATPHRDDVVGPFPTRLEPSDHVLIAADVVLDEK